ncbi:MAG: hypothetical protein KJT03_05145 [Verrucomicrobiae bacterium]|nr:hypothetical protein [Verrucomicrobiae bacterium]
MGYKPSTREGDFSVMKYIALMLVLLFGGFGIAWLGGADIAFAGRIAICAVFGFTAVGHFLKVQAMMDMMPLWIPGRYAIVVGSGVLEGVLAALVLFPAYAKVAGIALCILLILVTPLNVYSAVQRIDFGGHGVGPKYLFVRIPMQILLLVWVFWFAVLP